MLQASGRMTLPHHITQRENYRHDVFEQEGDFALYYTWMSRYTDK